MVAIQVSAPMLIQTKMMFGYMLLVLSELFAN